MKMIKCVDGIRSELTPQEESDLFAAEAVTQAILAEKANTRDLTPPEFQFLLSYTGLEDIWTGLEQNFKGPNRRQYAVLKATREKAYFNLDATLAMVAQFRPAAASIDPNVDLSDAAITAAWAESIKSGV